MIERNSPPGGRNSVSYFSTGLSARFGSAQLLCGVFAIRALNQYLRPKARSFPSSSDFCISTAPRAAGTGASSRSRPSKDLSPPRLPFGRLMPICPSGSSAISICWLASPTADNVQSKSKAGGLPESCPGECARSNKCAGNARPSGYATSCLAAEGYKAKHFLFRRPSAGRRQRALPYPPPGRSRPESGRRGRAASCQKGVDPTLLSPAAI